MPLYKYKYTIEGEEREETREFADKAALYSTVRGMKGSIISTSEITDKKGKFSLFNFRRRIKAQDQIAFAKNLAVMVDAGLSVSRALTVLQKQSSNKALSEIYESLIFSINAGEPLSQALSEHSDIFSDLFVAMVKAGEESGQLAGSLRVVADQLEKSHLLVKKVKGAMIYPSVILIVMFIIGLLLMLYMVPTLTETFKGLNISLPLPTRIIIAISDFLRNNILLTMVVILGVIAGVMSLLKTKRGKSMFDTIVLHLPMIGTMAREVNAARTARTLASLISSGVDIVGALGITSSVLQNHHFKELLDEAAKKVQVGEPLSASLSVSRSDLYPVFVGEMLSVGEETGKMTEMLQNIADYYEGEVDQKTKDLSTIIEPVLMVFIGVAVGVFAIAMMLPTYSLVDSIK